MPLLPLTRGGHEGENDTLGRRPALGGSKHEKITKFRFKYAKSRKFWPRLAALVTRGLCPTEGHERGRLGPHKLQKQPRRATLTVVRILENKQLNCTEIQLLIFRPMTSGF
jgi:hypothetical protein